MVRRVVVVLVVGAALVAVLAVPGPVAGAARPQGGASAPPREVGELEFSEDGGIEREEEVVSERTEFSRTFATSVPGVFETVSSAAPLHFEGADGGWRRFDNDLEAAPGDVVAPAATDVPVAIATDALVSELVSVEPVEGVSVGFGLEGAVAVEAELDSDTATFSDVVEGVDVELTALDRGVKETIVLDSPESPTEFRFPLVLDGVTAVVSAVGEVEYRDAGGVVLAVTPAGFMVDSAVARGVGERSDAVTYTVEDDGSGPVLVVSVDPGWLADPARVFPVLVDPTLTPPLSTVEVGADDTYVAESGSGDSSTSGSLYVGYGDGVVLRSYLQFPGLDDFDGMNVYDARLDLTQVSGTSCSPGPVEAYPVPTEWEGSEVTSWPGPVEDLVERVAIDSASGTVGFGASGCTSPGTVSVHLTAGAARWTSMDPGDSWANNGVMLRAANESPTGHGFREFASADSSSPPTLNLIWSDPSDAGEGNSAPTVSGPFSPQGDLVSDEVVASAVYDDADDDEGHVTYFTYLPGTFLFASSPGPVVGPGERSEIEGTIPWDARFSMRVVSVEGSVDAPGLPHSPLSPFFEFEARSVQITDPVQDQVLFDDVTVTATTAVTTNLTGVEFLFDGFVVSTDTTAPYEMAGSSTGATDGPHTLAARAVDSSGPPRTSATIDVTVDNGLNTQQRLQVDLVTDAIDLDKFTEYGVKGLLNQDAIPTRYQSEAEPSVDPTAGVLSYLGNGWEAMSPGTQGEIESFVAGSTTLASADPACTGDVVVLNLFELEFPQMCVYDTGDFLMFYKVGGEGGVDAGDGGSVHGGNGIPNYIDRMVVNLDVARAKYLDMGYELATGSAPLPVLVLDVEDGFASPFGVEGLGHFIIVETSAEGEDYTARHELFHIAQYSYTSLYDLGTFGFDFGDFVNDRESTMWWLEASANWAAHQAALTTGDPYGDDDEALVYASNLRFLFGAPANYFAAFDSVVELDLDQAGTTRGNSRAYGSFIFAEWLQQQYGNDFLLDIWEGVGQGGGDGREASEVMEDLLVDEDTTIEEDLPRFWLANYLFSDDSGLDGTYHYTDSHLDRLTPGETESWQSWLTRTDAPTQGDVFSALDRPARWTIEGIDGDGATEEREVRVEPGGTAFVDLAPEADLQGDLELSVEIDDPGHIDKYRFSTVAYEDSTTPVIASGLPAVCRRFGEPVLETVASEEGAFVLRVQIDEACRTATLAITNIDPNSGDDDGDEFVIAAEFNGTAPISGIELVSVDSFEHQGNGASGQASIAPGGASVVFTSAATNLVATEVGEGTEIYRRTLPANFAEGTTLLVSGGDDDAEADHSGYPVVSSDGQVVAFASLDDDLDTSGEPSDGAQVYVANLGADTVERVSLFTPAVGQVAAAGRPSISADGRYVAYEGGGYTGLERPGSPSGVSAIYLYDRQTDTTVCVSCVAGAVTAASFGPDINVEGTVVAFSSAASGLVAGDTNGVADVFAYDIGTGTHTRRSGTDEGGQSSVASTNPRGGSGTAYQQGTSVHAVRGGDITVFAGKELVDLAGSGWAITYADDDEVFQECPFATSDPAPLAVGIGGPPSGPTAGGSLTLNGSKTAFQSAADNLIGGDVNATADVFVTSSTSCAEG